MSGQTKERAFEVHVEEVLHQQGGWQSGTNAEWDVERALFPARVFAFLRSDAAEALGARCARCTAPDWRRCSSDALVKELDLKGRCTCCATASSSTGRPSGSRTSSRRTGSTTRCWRSTPRTSSRSRGRCRVIRASTTRWTCCSRSTGCRSPRAS